MEIPCFFVEKDATPGDKARHRYMAGYSCAEATILGLRDCGLIHCTEDMLRAATGFSGGLGGSYQGLCGALSAGVMALGFLYGRSVFLVSSNPCAQRVKRLIERFNETRSSAICKDLTAGFDYTDSKAFGSPERKALCAEIVRHVGNLVAETAYWEPPKDKTS